MSDVTSKDRAETVEHLRVLFGAAGAKALTQAGWPAIIAAADDPNHVIVRGWPKHHLERLRALVHLCQLYYPAQDFRPHQVFSSADAARFYVQRCLTLRERVVWLLCLDPSRTVTDDILVQMGGEPFAPPPVKVLLRHALIKGADSVVVADHRTVALLRPDPETIQTLRALRELGEIAGVRFLDYLVLNADTALSVDEFCSVQMADERAA